MKPTGLCVGTSYCALRGLLRSTQISCWESRLADVSASGIQTMADGLLEGAKALPEGESPGCQILLEGAS